MMKKYLVVAVVLATVCLSSAAFAADVTVNGFVGIRSRLFEGFDMNRSAAITDATSRRSTETAYRVDVNVKADSAKAKLSVWNDYDAWGRTTRNDNTTNMGLGSNALNTSSTTVGGTSTLSRVFIREAWIDVMIPGTPVGVKAGRMNTMIGNGWFFRSNYGGVDAWIAYANVGPVTIALQDAKISENQATIGSNVDTSTNDVDLYTAMVTAKLGDAGTVGLDFSALKDNTGLVLATPTWAAGQGTQGRLYNAALQANVKAGPATIKAEADYQWGYVEQAGGDTGYRGYQIVIQPSVKAGIVTINALAAMGSGNTANRPARTAFVNFMDIGQHYTLIYEYRIAGAGGANQGFVNTTALSVGAMVDVLKNLAVGADVYYLRATEAVVLNGNTSANPSRDLGWEVDAKLNWKITKDVSWNWQVGYFAPGGAYNLAGDTGKADAAWGAQGILGLAF